MYFPGKYVPPPQRYLVEDPAYGPPAGMPQYDNTAQYGYAPQSDGRWDDYRGGGRGGAPQQRSLVITPFS